MANETQSNLAFCEYSACRVLLYTLPAPSSQGDIEATTNCPSCGRFGRLKDVPVVPQAEIIVEEDPTPEDPPE